ncbi:RNA-directed DNA polymerase, eukaryota, partial [Tanacetum coccineum]
MARELVSDGNFRVKEIRNYIDDLFLPHQAAQTRWIKYIPIKVNIFAWRARQDCLPTRVNLIRRGITIESSLCPVCSVCEEDVCHIFFRCDLAQLVLRRICRWWGLDPHDWSSFQEWQSWILSIQFSSKVKAMLEGVPQKPNSSIPRGPNHSTPKETNMENSNNSFVSVLKRGSQSHVTPEITKPALVLDDTCIKEFDFGMSLMGRAKDVSAIPNLPCIISKE